MSLPELKVFFERVIENDLEGYPETYTKEQFSSMFESSKQDSNIIDALFENENEAALFTLVERFLKELEKHDIEEEVPNKETDYYNLDSDLNYKNNNNDIENKAHNNFVHVNDEHKSEEVKGDISNIHSNINNNTNLIENNDNAFHNHSFNNNTNNNYNSNNNLSNENINNNRERQDLTPEFTTINNNNNRNSNYNSNDNVNQDDNYENEENNKETENHIENNFLPSFSKENLVKPSNNFSLYKEQEKNNQVKEEEDPLSKIKNYKYENNLPLNTDEVIFPVNNKNYRQIKNTTNTNINIDVNNEESRTNINSLENNNTNNAYNYTSNSTSKPKFQPNSIYNPKTSKFQDILNTFPDKSNKLNTLFQMKAESIKETHLSSKVKKNKNDSNNNNERDDNTIIYPSNTKKTTPFEERQTEYLSSLYKENQENERNKGGNVNDKLPDMGFTFNNSINNNNHNIVSNNINNSKFNDNLPSKTSSNLMYSMSMTKNLIESLNNNKSKNINYSKNSGNTKLTSNNKNIISSNKNKNSTEVNNEVVAQVNQMPINKKPTVEQQQKIKSQFDNYKASNNNDTSKSIINSSTNKKSDYFVELFKGIQNKNKNMNVLNDKILRYSEKELNTNNNNNDNIDIQENHNYNDADRYQTAQFTDNNDNSHNINNLNNENMENIISTNTMSQISNLLETFENNNQNKNKNSNKDLRLKDLPQVDLKDNESKQNYASVIKRNLEEFTKKKSELSKNRGDYFSNIDKKITTLQKNPQTTEQSSTIHKFKDFLDKDKESRKNQDVVETLNEKVSLKDFLNNEVAADKDNTKSTETNTNNNNNIKVQGSYTLGEENRNNNMYNVENSNKVEDVEEVNNNDNK